MRRIIDYILRTPSAGLLGVQILGLVLYPFMEHTTAGRALFGAFGLIVLGAALWVVRRGPWLTWLGVLLALPVVVLSIINAIAPSPYLPVITAALEAAFYFYAAGSLIVYMMHDYNATTDELFAVGATFTLLAWGFAYLFVICQALMPGSFGAQLNPEAMRSWMELLFLSFTILSGVGLGDILPLSPLARGLVMIEQIAGVMYIALVVSRVVGLTLAAARNTESNKQA